MAGLFGIRIRRCRSGLSRFQWCRQRFFGSRRLVSGNVPLGNLDHFSRDFPNSRFHDCRFWLSRRFLNRDFRNIWCHNRRFQHSGRLLNRDFCNIWCHNRRFQRSGRLINRDFWNHWLCNRRFWRNEYLVDHGFYSNSFGFTDAGRRDFHFMKRRFDPFKRFSRWSRNLGPCFSGSFSFSDG